MKTDTTQRVRNPIGQLVCVTPGSTHLQRLVLQVHLEQRVPHQVSEPAAVEVAVGPSVAPAVVDLGELQASVLLQVVAVKVLKLAEHLSEASRGDVSCGSSSSGTGRGLVRSNLPAVATRTSLSRQKLHVHYDFGCSQIQPQ